MKNEQKFYVYTLAYPDGTVFYVDKGSNKRIYTHEMEARKGKQSHKCCTIRKIWREGGKVLKEKVAFFNNEAEAFLFEQQLIGFFGQENLTNRQSCRRDLTKNCAAKRGIQLALHAHNQWR